MKKIIYTALLFFSVFSAVLTISSCNDYETYADQKKKEKNNINKFIQNNDVCGPIKVISETQFYQQDSTTNVDENEFVMFEEDGVYMQIVNKGEGRTFPEMSKSYTDSIVNANVLCRFMEYSIESGDTTRLNYGRPLWVDKLLITYTDQSRSYGGSFISGLFASSGVFAIPSGLMKPLDYIRISRDPETTPRVRLIVPHTSGTSDATQMVQPYYYDITYQLGK